MMLCADAKILNTLVVWLRASDGAVDEEPSEWIGLPETTFISYLVGSSVAT